MDVPGIPDFPDFPDLPGTVKVMRADDVMRDVTAFRFEHRLTAVKFAGVVQVSREMLGDTAVPLKMMLWGAMDRALRPWKYPDRPRVRLIDWPLGRRIDRIAAWFRRR